MAYSSKYAFELWTKNGVLLADLGGLAQERSFTESRNQAEDIQFNLDLDAFENYCRRLGIDPKQLLLVNSTEVRIKRLGTYLAGGQLMYKSTSLSATSNKVQARVFGFLALFNKRFTGTSDAGFISEVHTAAEGTAKSRKDLAWYLINASQSLTNGDFGITVGPNQSSNTTLYDKTYSRTRIKDALQNMTELKTSPIDFWFTYDKTFNTSDYMGSNRPDIVFEYPGNIISMDVPDDGTDMVNEVIGLPSGASDGTAIPYFATDTASQATYGLRQDIFQSNATDNSDNGLTDEAEAVKAAKSNPIKVPALTVNGNVAPFVSDYRIGDRVTVKVTGHPLISDINGAFRIEKRTVTIDNEDNETITLQVSTT